MEYKKLIDEIHTIITMHGSEELRSAFESEFLPSNDASWVEEWIALWPTNQYMKSIGHDDKSLVDPNACKKSMAIFIKDFYKLTSLRLPRQEKIDLIFKATTAYINLFKSGKRDWRFIRKANFFISKRGEPSELVIQIRDIQTSNNIPDRHKLNEMV